MSVSLPSLLRSLEGVIVQYIGDDNHSFRIVIIDPSGQRPPLHVDFVYSETPSNDVRCSLGSNRRSLGFKGWHWGAVNSTTHIVIFYGGMSARQALSNLLVKVRYSQFDGVFITLVFRDGFGEE